MTRLKTRLPALASTRFVTAMPLHAETSLSYTLGSGSGDYRSHALEGSIDLRGLPLEASFDAMKAKAAGVDVMDQYGLGLTWRPAPTWSANYRFSNVKDQVFDIDGHEFGLSLYLNKWWSSELETRLDLGAAAFDYGLRGNNPALSGLVPDQRRYALGIRQDLSNSLSLYATFDKFHYTRDPVALARLLVASRRPRINAAFTLVGFPDQTRTFGASWDVSQTINLDLSYSRTDSVIRQQQQSVKLAMTYFVTKNGSFTLGYSESRSGDVFRPNGTLLIGKDRSSNLELTLGWSFD